MAKSRIMAAALTVLALVLVVAAALDTRRLVGQVFPGFLVFDLNSPGDSVPRQVVVIAPVALSHWGEPGTTVPPRAVVVAVDEQLVASSAALYAVVAAKQPGASVQYRLETRYVLDPLTVTVAARRFTETDWLDLFGPSAITVGVFLLVGLLAVVRASDDALCPALAAVTLMAALFELSRNALMTASPLAPIWLQLHMLAFSFWPSALLHWTLVVLEPERYTRWRYAGYVVSALLLILYDAASYYFPTELGATIRNRVFFATWGYLGIAGVLAIARYMWGDWSAYGGVRQQRLLRALALVTGMTFPSLFLLLFGGSDRADPRLILTWLTFPLFAGVLLRQRRALRTAVLAEAPRELPVGEDGLTQPPPVSTTPVAAKRSTASAIDGDALREIDAAMFRKEGEYWTVAFAGRTVRLRDVVGLRHIAELLRHPGETIPAGALMAAIRGMPSTGGGANNSQIFEAGLRTSNDPNGGAGVDLLIDARSRQEYRQRLEDIRAELDECDEKNDVGRAEELRTEMALLNDELTSAVRGWRGASSTERARLSVTKTIKAALAKIGEEHPELHRHLIAHIKTGATCTYVPDPDRRVRWDT